MSEANEELGKLDMAISQLEARVAQMRASLQEEAAILQTTSVQRVFIYLSYILVIGCRVADIGKG